MPQGISLRRLVGQPPRDLGSVERKTQVLGETRHINHSLVGKSHDAVGPKRCNGINPT